jgi:hypothetical protein
LREGVFVGHPRSPHAILADFVSYCREASCNDTRVPAKGIVAGSHGKKRDDSITEISNPVY